jgi:hypothetical protein
LNTIRPLCCGIAAHASVLLDEEVVAAMRRQPGSLRGEPLPPNLLRHSDEQTIAALAALLSAVDSARLDDDFTDWGIVAASRFVGRTALAQAVVRFINEGPWGVSPHLIPHRSPHSPTGTLSQALKLHGPNCGAGGGPGAETEGLLTALGMLHASGAPGVWLVMSRMVPEGDCDLSVGRAFGTQLHALALALTPPGRVRPTLELDTSAGCGAPLTMDALDELLKRFSAGADVDCRLGDVGRLVLRHNAPAYAGPHTAVFALDPLRGW